MISLRIRVLFRACLPCEQSHLRSSFLFPIFPKKIEGDSARRVIRVGILSLHRNACHAEKTMNTVTHQPLMLQKCNFSTFYPILCRLILISEQKFLFSEHKYTKQCIAKTKYNLHNSVHRLN